MRFLDDLFQMGGGYVLDFSNATFAEFFDQEIGADIDEPKYAAEGGSKGKRLRYFLQSVDKPTVIRTLRSLWDYREDFQRRAGTPETVANARDRLLALIDRLSQNSSSTGSPEPAKNAVDVVKIAQLRVELLNLSSLDPQPRGFAFERFLKQLFDANRLEARDAFRLRGEQIDGSFQFAGQTYLLEAKWRNAPSGVADLHTFQGKIDQKAAWTRGLFISNSGFSDEGLSAFGRGKSVICMDGLDLFDTLNRGLSFVQVLDRKVRRAAETGFPFARVRDLFS